jgi:phenylalanyl-tRNA synthetase beta chain
MQFSESWLREYCNPPIDTQALADLLTNSGMEVEELNPVAPPFTGVVVAEILTAVQHPNADRLRVCTVDAGPKHSAGGPLQIVCGAANARAGIKVPLATIGASLPPGPDGKPFVIGQGKLRGVDSFGMLCAADELGLGGDHSGLLELPHDAPVGLDIRAFLQLDDMHYMLKLTPNLAHGLSVYGIARELSALTGSPLRPKDIKPVAVAHQSRLPVTIKAPELCGRFSGRVIKNVNTKVETPDWMVRRLLACGQRSVSVLVDISNYVMFEYGQPNHIFDFDKIKGGLQIRWAEPGESCALLNGKTVELDGKVGVVADDAGVESLAGIMGGEASSVGDSTTNIYVEAAFWHPSAVAGRSRRFNFTTDAGHRFERGVDPAGTVDAIEHITHLVMQICGGDPGPIDDQAPNLPERQPVTLRVARAAKVLGVPVTQDQVVQVFQRMGLQFSVRPGELTVVPPSWRFDLAIEEDLIEEAIRVLGLGLLNEEPPAAPIQARLHPERLRGTHALRRAAAELGYLETINYSFVEERWERDLAGNTNPIRLLNPIAAPLAVMRSSLIGSLVQVLRHNLARRAVRVRVFELGRVFARDAAVADSLSSVAGIHQPLRLAGLAYGPADALQWGEADKGVDFFDVKGDVEALLAPRQARFAAASHPAMHPGRCAAIELDGRVVGHVGELHPKWRLAYELPHSPVLFEIEADTLLDRPLPKGQGVPKHQAAERDIALIVPVAVNAQAVLDAIRASDKTGVLREAILFDVYRPAKPQGDIAEHERSLAIRLGLLDDAAPLTEERIAALVDAAVAAAAKNCQARLRA